MKKVVGRLKKSLSVKALLFSLVLPTGWAAASVDCSDPAEYRASSVQMVSGFSRAKLNREGNLVITLDHDADERVDRIYRMDLVNTDQRRQALSRWAGREIELRVQTWIIEHRKVHEFFPIRSKNGFVVASRDYECLEAFIEGQPMPPSPIYLRTAISTHTPGALVTMSHDEAIDAFAEKGLFEPDSDSVKSEKGHPPPTTHSGPLYCASGGEGATGCSINYGGIGGLTAGSCSVSGCQAPSFACCGPGWGSHCVCRYPDESGPGGGIGDPGDDSGGSGDTGGGGASGDESECDEPDPPAPCDDSDRDTDEIGN